MNIKKKKPRAGLRCHSYRAESQSGWEPEISKNSVSNGELRQVATVLSQPYPGTADLCLGGPVPSPQLVGIHMENLTPGVRKQEGKRNHRIALQDPAEYQGTEAGQTQAPRDCFQVAVAVRCSSVG